MCTLPLLDTCFVLCCGLLVVSPCVFSVISTVVCHFSTSQVIQGYYPQLETCSVCYALGKDGRKTLEKMRFSLQIIKLPTLAHIANLNYRSLCV